LAEEYAELPFSCFEPQQKDPFLQYSSKQTCIGAGGGVDVRAFLTLILLMWRIRRAPNNVSKWQMGFNSAFKGLTQVPDRMSMRYSSCGVTPEEKKKE